MAHSRCCAKFLLILVALNFKFMSTAQKIKSVKNIIKFQLERVYPVGDFPVTIEFLLDNEFSTASNVIELDSVKEANHIFSAIGGSQTVVNKVVNTNGKIYLSSSVILPR